MALPSLDALTGLKAAVTQEQGTPNGFLKPETNWGKYNSDSFVILHWLQKLQTSIPVQVQAVTNAGELSPVGFVDILPLVNQIDGQGVATPHETIFHVPYFRLQGGANAIILDPQVGDIGIAICASRDITKVKNTKAQSNPGSFRDYSLADAMYIGGILNGMPQQFVQFNETGIQVVSPVAVTVTAPVVNVVAEASVNVTAPITNIASETSINMTSPIITFTGQLVTTGNTTANGISVDSHTHSGVESGSGNTGPPS